VVDTETGVAVTEEEDLGVERNRPKHGDEGRRDWQANERGREKEKKKKKRERGK
jgi:hypothetical protein